MSARIKVDIAGFKQQLQATADKMNQATRPAAQAGAQIVYERARQLAPVSDSAHMFKIEGRSYGPYPPGNLRDSIYQVFSRDNSFTDVSVYHVSWNADKAPYGGMVEMGTSQAQSLEAVLAVAPYGGMVEFGTSKAPAHSFIGRAVAETRKQVREAMKQRYIDEVNSKL